MTSFDPKRRDLLKFSAATGGALAMGDLWPGTAERAEGASAASRLRGRSRVKGCMTSPLLNGTRGGSRILNRRDDVVVRAAAAEIAADPVADLLR